MKALHIATKTQVVKEVDMDGKLKTLQGFVGGFIERVRLPNGDDLWVNEEGLLVPADKQVFFALDEFIFAGEALITGPGRRPTPCQSELFDVIHRIKWMQARRLA